MMNLLKEQRYTVTALDRNSLTYKWEENTFEGIYKGFCYDEDGMGIHFFRVDGEVRPREYTEDDLKEVK